MKTGIVFEGGAFRTIFSCGVMDAFLEKDIMPDYMIGVSAGAAFGVSYASAQKGRNLEIVNTYARDKRYMGANNLVNPRNRSYYNLDFVYGTVPNELVPFDYDAYMAYAGEFLAVVTNVETGQPEYFPVDLGERDLTLLEATCALPVLFPIIEYKGNRYLDGGLSDPIPFEKALEDGCDRVVVVLTREQGYIKKTTKTTRLTARAYLRYPELAKALMKRARRYNKSLARLEEYRRDGRVMVICPDSTEGFSRTERNLDKINALYQDGYNKGTDLSGQVREFYQMN
jgi:predicted patatin/cPLA2 family phospholipase